VAAALTTPASDRLAGGTRVRGLAMLVTLQHGVGARGR
jgi:hypothetical protein